MHFFKLQRNEFKRNSIDIGLDIQFFGVENTKMLLWMPLLGWAKNQCSACRVSMFGDYCPKSFPGHSHFGILEFFYQQQIENYFKIL